MGARYLISLWDFQLAIANNIFSPVSTKLHPMTHSNGAPAEYQLSLLMIFRNFWRLFIHHLIFKTLYYECPHTFWPSDEPLLTDSHLLWTNHPLTLWHELQLLLLTIKPTQHMCNIHFLVAKNIFVRN